MASSGHLSLRNVNHTFCGKSIPPHPNTVVIYRHGGKLVAGGPRLKGQGDYDLRRVCGDWFSGSSNCSSTSCNGIHGLTTGEPLCPHMFKLQMHDRPPTPTCHNPSCPHIHAQNVQLPAIDPRPLCALAERLYQDLTAAEAIKGALYGPKLLPLQVPVPVRLRQVPGKPFQKLKANKVEVRFFATHFVCYRDIGQCHFGGDCSQFWTYAGCFYRHRQRKRSRSRSRSKERLVEAEVINTTHKATHESLQSQPEPKQEAQLSRHQLKSPVTQSHAGKLSAAYLPSPDESPDYVDGLLGFCSEQDSIILRRRLPLPSPPADVPLLLNKRARSLQGNDHEVPPRKVIKTEQESLVVPSLIRKLSWREDSPSPSRPSKPDFHSESTHVTPSSETCLVEDGEILELSTDQAVHPAESEENRLVPMEFS